MEKTLAPEYAPSQADQDSFAEASLGWAKSLIARHDKLGVLGVLDYDPAKYPSQRIDVVKIPAFQPSFEQLMEGGQIALTAGIMRDIRSGARRAMGSQYDHFVEAIKAQQIHAGQPEEVLRYIWGRTNTPKHEVSVVVEHNDLLAPALAMAALTDAYTRADLAHTIDRGRPARNFNFFDLSRRSYFYINKSLSFLSIFGRPAIEPMALIGNVMTVVPPTRSSLEMNFDRNVVKYNLRNTKQTLDQDRAALAADNKSMIHYIAPYASTSQKQVSPSTTNELIGSLALPISLSVAGEQSDWWIGPVQSITRGAVLSRMMAELDSAAEQRLARGRHAALGKQALASETT